MSGKQTVFFFYIYFLHEMKLKAYRLTHSSQLFHNKYFSKPHHSLIIISILKQHLSQMCEYTNLPSNTKKVFKMEHTPAIASGLNKIQLFHYPLDSNSIYSAFADASF